MINPRVDFAFKKLFGDEKSKDILIALINAIVSELDQVSDIQLLNPYNEKSFETDKLTILDIKATDKNGKQYNIEMQLADQTYYDKRALYYWSRFYASQLKEGDPVKRLNKTISIHILNFDCFEEEADYHNVFKLLNIKSHKSYFEDLEIHFIELAKLDEAYFTQPMKTALDRWVKFLRQAHAYEHDKLPDDLQKVPAIKKAFSALETLSLNEKEYRLYEARLDWLRDEAAIIETSAMKAKEAGIKEGVEKGKAEGIKEGKAEGMKETAKNLLQMGRLSVADIAKATGLTESGIRALKEK